MKQLTIQRSKWYRGQGASTSRLLTVTKMMCCLGFEAIACGYTPDQILDQEDPAQLTYGVGSPASDEERGYMDRHVFDHDDVEGRTNNAATEKAMVWNDRDDVTEEAREAALTTIFAQWGIELVFED